MSNNLIAQSLRPDSGRVAEGRLLFELRIEVLNPPLGKRLGIPFIGATQEHETHKCDFEDTE